MEVNGEHFTPSQTSLMEIEVNLDRYLYALKFLEDKTVIDLGCGAGFGTYLYSLVAKKVYAIDYSTQAISEAMGSFNFPKKNVEFIKLDLTKPEEIANIPEHDVCVALEILEHLEDPAMVLKALRGTQLVFSVPLHSMEVSSWHRFPIVTEADVRNLIEPCYQIGGYENQTHPRSHGEWVRGEGIKYES